MLGIQPRYYIIRIYRSSRAPSNNVALSDELRGVVEDMKGQTQSFQTAEELVRILALAHMAPQKSKEKSS